MTDSAARFVNVCPVFVSADIRRTVKFYTEQLGFHSAKHYDKVENFAALYRDAIEIIVIQARHGAVESNLQRHGEGYDAYIDPAAVEGVDLVYSEFQGKDVKILVEPHRTDYGSYEFVIEDCDGRRIGIGRIAEPAVFFKDMETNP